MSVILFPWQFSLLSSTWNLLYPFINRCCTQMNPSYFLQPLYERWMTKGKKFLSFVFGRWNREEQAGQTAQVQIEEQGWSQEGSLSPGRGTSKEQGKQIHRKLDFITSTSLKTNPFVQFTSGYSMNLSNLLLDWVAIKRPCQEGGFSFSSP